jgi:hypothetical protein
MRWSCRRSGWREPLEGALGALATALPLLAAGLVLARL